MHITIIILQRFGPEGLFVQCVPEEGPSENVQENGCLGVGLTYSTAMCYYCMGLVSKIVSIATTQ